MTYYLFYRVVKHVGKFGYSKCFDWAYGGAYDTSDDAVRSVFKLLPDDLFEYQIVDVTGSVLIKGENY